MSWTHAACSDCYRKEEPGRKPSQLKDLKAEICCFCGKPTLDGIYYRQDPKSQKLRCGGTCDK